MNILSVYNQILPEKKLFYINHNSCFDLIVDKYFENDICRVDLNRKHIQYFTYNRFISNDIVGLISQQVLGKLSEIGLHKGICFIHSDLSILKKEDRRIIFDTLQDHQVINLHPSNDIMTNITYGIPCVTIKPKEDTNRILIINNRNNQFLSYIAQQIQKTYLVDLLLDFNIFDSYEACVDLFSNYSIIITSELIDQLCATSVGCDTIDLNANNSMPLIVAQIKSILDNKTNKKSNTFDFNEFSINNFVQNIEKAINKL